MPGHTLVTFVAARVSRSRVTVIKITDIYRFVGETQVLILCIELQIFFVMQMTAKQLERSSKKCEKNEKKERKLIKTCITKGRCVDLSERAVQ